MNCRNPSLRKDSIQFGATSVAQDRYRKLIHEHEQNRAESNYTRSALAGSATGLALRRGKMSRGRAAAIGSGAGIAAQAVVRAATAETKDNFGDRSYNAKRVEKLPWQIGAATASVAGYKRVAGKARKLTFGVPSVPSMETAAGRFADFLKSRHVRAGLALTGGIATADAVTSGVRPDEGRSRLGSAVGGAGRGALYGAVLAGVEPLLKKRLANSSGKLLGGMAFSGRRSLIQFGGRQQMRDMGNRFVDPLDVASGVSAAYHRDERGVYHPVDVPVRHAQVIRAALNKGRAIHRYGSRTGGLVSDASDALRGKRKADSRGRPLKREWEKSWFKNAVGAAAVGAGLLGHAHAMRRNPEYRAKVQKAVRRSKTAANSVVPDLFPMAAKTREMRFDVSAPDWDVRDQRGRSARVFAPGAQRRWRREKKWHERSENQRRLLGALAVAAGAAGLAGGYKVGATKGVKAARRKTAQKAAATRRAAKAENETIEKMKRRGGGGASAS